MSFENRANFGYGQVATAPSPATSGTTLTLASGAGALFPSTNFSIVAYPPNKEPLASNAEICFVSSRTGDVLTITRAQQSTSARSIAIGWQIANAITTKDLDDIETAIAGGAAVWGAITGTLSNQTDLQSALDAKLDKSANLSDVVSASTSFDNIKQSSTDSYEGAVELATVGESGTGTDTSRAVTAAGIFPAEVTVASGTTTNIGAAASVLVQITGTTTITAFDTVAAGIRRQVRFGGILTLTNSSGLILPTGSNITTAANDSLLAVSLGSGNWIVEIYQKADGTALAGGSGAAIWGMITGTLSAQTDLQAALDAKLAKASNLTDVANAATAFANIKQAATTSATGVVELATVAEAGLGTDTSRAVFPGGLYPPYATVSSGTTTNIGAANTSRVVVTGTTTITAFDTVAEGIVRNLVFSGILILTHNGTSLILPGAANITTAVGDCATAVSEGSGNWRVTAYQRANGTALAGGAAVWGAITGTLSNQTDLQSALDAKQNVLSQAVLTYSGTTNIDLTGADYQTLSLTGNVTFTTSNKAAARSKTVIITCDGTPRTFTFPSWVWIGVGAPTGIAASKKGVLSLTCLGTADTDIIAVYSVQNP